MTKDAANLFDDIINNLTDEDVDAFIRQSLRDNILFPGKNMPLIYAQAKDVTILDDLDDFLN